MKFSVLMSVYKNDVPEFFQEALESVTINQTIKPSQVVIIQDGYVLEIFDAIIKIVSNKSSEIEFTIIKKEQNEGLAAALNTGIEACKYKWIARMDSDDISLPERFEKQINFIKQNPTTDVLGGNIAEFQILPGDINSERHVGLNKEDIMRMAKRRTPMNHVSVIYRKEAVLSAGKYSENFGKLEDYKLWVDMLSAGNILANINDILVYVRIGNGFIERRSNKREIEDWDMLQTYLLKNGFINKLDSLKNKIYIRLFIYMPSWLKKLAYKILLRK